MCKLNARQVLIVSTVVFITVALFHLLRLIHQAQFTISGFVLPMEASVAAVIVLAYLAYESWKAIPKRTNKTKAQVILGLFVADIVIVTSLWAYGVEYFMFSGSTWAGPFILDLIVIGILWNYIRKKKR